MKKFAQDDLVQVLPVGYTVTGNYARITAEIEIIFFIQLLFLFDDAKVQLQNHNAKKREARCTNPSGCCMNYRCHHKSRLQPSIFWRCSRITGK